MRVSLCVICTKLSKCLFRAEVAELFEPSIEAAISLITHQVETTDDFVKVGLS